MLVAEMNAKAQAAATVMTHTLQELIDMYAINAEAARRGGAADIELARQNLRMVRAAAREALRPGEIRRFTYGRLTGSVMTVGTGQTQYLVRMDGEVLGAFSGTTDREHDALRSWAGVIQVIVGS